jgi:hypothetical protein
MDSPAFRPRSTLAVLLALLTAGAVAPARPALAGEEAGPGLKAPITLKDPDGPIRFSLLLGALDEVMLYDRALTPEEVAALGTARQAEP